MRFAIITVALVGCAGAFEPLPRDARKDIVDHAAKLEKCQAEGRAKHSFQAYADCKLREGL